MGKVGVFLGPILLLLGVAACGESKQTRIIETPSQQFSNAAGLSIHELEEQLAKALAECGIDDPSKVPAAAPSGADNAVFDLSADLIDTDGAGGNPPTGVTLAWTERMLGDYDANGEVGYPDLVPLAQHWLAGVTYDNSTLHGGFAYWPVGDPEDSGSGSANWVLARVDGDGNTEVGTGGDIVAIAEHWNERLAGYRVYAKAPGEFAFSLLTTLDHPAGTHADAPVRYSFDASISGTGLYSYYIAPVDADGSEGTASGIFTIDVDTGTVNHTPVAALKLSPDFASAPATITLDASASYDVDGDALTYAWDFDADGTVDWVSTDAVPEESSAGLVDSITPAASGGIVTVQFLRGSADWYYPEVFATDDESAASDPISVQLGISGWEHVEISRENDTSTKVNFDIESLEVDPATGRVVAAGVVDHRAPSNYVDEDLYGVYFVWRQVDGTWLRESAFDPSVPEWDLDLYDINILDMFWMADGQPGVFFYGREGIMGRVRYYVSYRRGAEDWLTQILWGGEDGEQSVSELGWDISGPGEFVFSGQYPSYSSGADSYKYYLIQFSQGNVTWLDTGLITDNNLPLDEISSISDLAVDPSGKVRFFCEGYNGFFNPELYFYDWSPPDTWELSRQTFGELEYLGRYYFTDMKYDAAGAFYGKATLDLSGISIPDLAVISNRDGDYKVLYSFIDAMSKELFILDNSSTIASLMMIKNQTSSNLEDYFVRYESGTILKENVNYPIQLETNGSYGPFTMVAFDQGEAWSVVKYRGSLPGEQAQYLANRIDPRF